MRTGIIAFCGSKGAGKNTAATLLQQILNGKTEELAFADHLKKTCSKVFNIDMKYFTNPSLKEVELDTYVVLNQKNVEQVFKEFEVEFQFEKHVRQHGGQVFDTPRSLLQYIGTEVLHPIDPLIHAKITLKKKDPSKLSIITDLRFLQEFEYLKTQADFLPIYIFNQKAEMIASGDTHKSEQELKLFKGQCEALDNNGEIPDLTKGVTKIVERFYR